MQRRMLFLVLATVGVLLLIGPFAYERFAGSDDPILPSVAEFFPVQDEVSGKWGFIDNAGNPVTATVFDWASDFRQGRGLVESDGAMGYIDSTFDATGKWAITPRFELRDAGDQSAFDFFDGRALVRNDAGLWGYIDTTGRWVIEPTFPEAANFPGLPAGHFSDGLAWFQRVEVSERNRLDRDGEVMRDAEENLIKENYPRRTFGYMDRKGNVVIEARYEMAQDFGEGLAAVRIKARDEWAFIDRDDNRVIPPRYDAVGRFSEGLCAVSINGRWGYIDAEGEEKIERKFDEARDFSEGLAAARAGDKWGYIDAKGNWVIPPTYDNHDDYAHPRDPRGFENGLARVTLNGSTIYIDPTGEQVWPKN